MFTVTPDACMTLHGNLLDNTLPLDKLYFGIGKHESACMDVEQKLLHVAHKDLEDTGFSGTTDSSTLDPVAFGVYVSSATDDFFKDPNSFPIDIYHLVCSQHAFLASQISHHFGLNGPAVSIDTVCTGTMTAFNTAASDGSAALYPWASRRHCGYYHFGPIAQGSEAMVQSSG